MTWYDNSNIDFKWNISKIITPTLSAKISFEDSKSLLFLHFFNRGKNFNYTDNCTSTFLLLIFWVSYTDMNISLLSRLLTNLIIFCSYIHSWINYFHTRTLHILHSIIYFWSTSLRSFLLTSFPRSSLFFFLVKIRHQPTHSSIIPLISTFYTK